MGFNTTVVILNDALHYIADDPEFGKKLEEAVHSYAGKPINVSVRGHGNAAQAVETHHADYDVLVRVGGNCGRIETEAP